MVRSRVRDWNIDPSKIGVGGYSAGANLICVIARLQYAVLTRLLEESKRNGKPSMAWNQFALPAVILATSDAMLP